MELGQVVQKNSLKPVEDNKKPKSKLEKILSSVKRSEVEGEKLVCAAISSNGKKGIFLNNDGDIFEITEDDLKGKEVYIDKKYNRKQVDSYTKTKSSKKPFEKTIKDFVEKSGNKSEYEDWDFIEIESSEDEPLNESAYEKGKTYKSKDGKWRFKVLSIGKDYVKIKDLGNNKDYKVEVSDLELTQPVLEKECK